MRIWHFYSQDELLTVEQQKIKERQEYLSLGFWIGAITMVVLFNLIIFL